ncbi:GNAT family N-acetyltransferase [Mechercharimyces sp. CAU 1602]|uniref:GNAT family N-acetyltransferase n=1 Tax=Mechercharimyces sp. CAU 1602 TaxID=2973933 RepID=UPI0021639CAB|nr:GNAT family protein [Mechercharimyces sp. CAU 1602]MCS1352590.1 GNAT family N-acetyltransferase [Mechercharimyces sp. CAU 1602]
MISSHPLILRPLKLSDAPALYDLRLRNQVFFAPYEPIRPESFTLIGIEQELRQGMLRTQSDQGYSFGIFLSHPGTLIGRINLSNVVRGAWQNCTIGYYIDHEAQGNGYMTTAVRSTVQFAFQKLHLHRVQAAIMPHNIASLRVIEKVGFRHEGLSKRYLHINGSWQDHEIYALTREEWDPDSI